MKTVIFFSRCKLGRMYGPVSNALKDKVNCLHIAYSKTEHDELINKFNINEDNIIILKNELKKYLVIPYVEKDLEDIDDVLLQVTDGRFTLNQSIQSDRALVYKDYSDCNKLSVALFRFWDEYFKKNKPVAIFHEMTSLLMNHICCVCAKLNNAYYISEIQVPGIHDANLLFCTYEGGWPKLTKKTESPFDRNKVLEFINEFREAPSTVLMGNIFKKEKNCKLLIRGIKRNILGKFKRNECTNDLVDYIDFFLQKENPDLNRFKNLQDYKKMKWDSFNPSLKYYYYPLHLEPEAAVLYWGDGLYANQIKLIENIAAQLPPGTWLYVKDHPHDIGYRKADDYLRLQRIPNIKVLYAKEPGKEIIKNSQGVITINGSVGLEAVLLKKNVYYFGHPYYEKACNTYKIENIKKLGNIIRTYSKDEFNDDKLYDFLSELFINSYKGNAALYFGEHISDKMNTKDVVNAFKDFIINRLITN